MRSWKMKLPHLHPLLYPFELFWAVVSVPFRFFRFPASVPVVRFGRLYGPKKPFSEKCGAGFKAASVAEVRGAIEADKWVGWGEAHTGLGGRGGREADRERSRFCAVLLCHFFLKGFVDSPTYDLAPLYFPPRSPLHFSVLRCCH